MEKIVLGKTKLRVTKTSFGALPIQRASFNEAEKILLKAYESGINYFDTARSYTDSEEKLGKFLSKYRENIIISTKSNAKELDKRDIPVNLGTVIEISSDYNSNQDTLTLLGYLKTKGIGLIKDQDSDTSSISKYTKKPVHSPSDIKGMPNIKQISPQSITKLTSDFYTKWKINRRGYIRRGAIADLLLISNNEQDELKIESIFIKGHRVFHQGASQNPDLTGESVY